MTKAYHIETLPEFYESETMVEGDLRLGEETLDVPRWVLHEVLLNKIENELAVHSVSLDEIHSKYPTFINTYDGKDRAYAAGFYYFTQADVNNSNVTEKEFVPKHLRKEKLDCISTNAKILFVRSADFSDKYIEQDECFLGYKSYKAFVNGYAKECNSSKKEIKNYIQNMYGITDDKSLKERQDDILNTALDLAFRDLGSEITFEIKTKDFSYTIYADNPINEEFLKLSNGDCFQENILTDDDVPEDIKEFLNAYEVEPLDKAVEKVA